MAVELNMPQHPGIVDQIKKGEASQWEILCGKSLNGQGYDIDPWAGKNTMTSISTPFGQEVLYNS